MYIGKTPTVGNFQVCDAISVVNGQAAYTLQVGGVNVAPESANHMLVSLNGILQKPGSSFTISGSTMTFASNLATGDVIDFVQILGNVLDIGQPSDDTVTAAKLNNDIISGQTALTAEPDDTDEFLVSDAGTIKRIDYSLIKGGGITMADQFRLNQTFQGDASPIASNLERVDTDGFGQLGTGMTESSGIFTFPTTGIYLISFNVHFTTDQSNDSRYNRAVIYTTTDNSSYSDAVFTAAGLPLVDSSFTSGNAHAQHIFDVTSTSTHKVRFDIDVDNSNMYVAGDTNRSETYMTFIRLGDT
jgi:hypothetical protein